MKSLCARYEVIINCLVLLVRQQRPMLPSHLFFHFFKTFFHYRRRCASVTIMNGHLIQSSMKEFSFYGRCRRVRQCSLGGGNVDDAQVGTFARDGDCEIQGFFRRPRNQFFWRVTPIDTKGWLQKFLGIQRKRSEHEYQACESNSYFHGAGITNEHGNNLALINVFRKSRRLQSGMVLVEATAALAMLTAVGMVLFKLTLNVITPRQHALQQVLSDAYLTFERAQAERVPFETLTSDADTLWPEFPDTASTDVEIGTLPGGLVVEGTVFRTRYADAGNLPAFGGSGTETTNPATMQIWRVQSVLRYTIGNRTYVKSRTVVRTQ